MTDLRTKYMGLELKNPIVVGSSGLTASVESIKELEAAGAGAVVLKSLFEEQINLEIDGTMKDYNPTHGHTEADDYVKYFEKQHIIDKYLKLIKEAKKEVDIPIIASINCNSTEDWINFAKDIEEAGADGLELNILNLPSNPSQNDNRNVQIHFDISKKIKETIKIPFALKIGYYFDNLANVIYRLSHTDAAAIVLFNYTYNPDIDIEKLEMISANSLSSPADLPISLRWIALCASSVDCDLAASTGVHDGEAVIKQLLAGATVVQMVSALYIDGSAVITNALETLKSWMETHKFNSINDFRGKLSRTKEQQSSFYERIQFIKYLQN